MENLEKVELVREKCGVSYQEAKEALEACAYDVLDAIIWLENQGKTQTRTASFETSGAGAQSTSPEMMQAQEEYHAHSRRTKVGEAWSGFRGQVRQIIRAGFEMTFIAERDGQRVVALPLIFMVLGILAWGATIWLLIIGLFFGFRYRVEGADPVTFDVNEAMDRAADVADSIKNDFSKEE